MVHWRAGGVSLVLDCSGDSLPRVLHWGADLGEVSDPELGALAAASVPPVVTNSIDQPVPVSVLPEQSVGWLGTPGLTGNRDGAAFSTAFRVTGATEDQRRLAVTARDEAAALTLLLEIELTDAGLVRQRATVTSEGGTEPYTVDGLLLALPVPTEATELLDLTGRHLRERSPQRRPFTPRRVGTREPARPHRRRRHAGTRRRRARASASGHGEVWGRARGVERQPPHARRAHPDRAVPCSAAANCCCPARSGSAPGEIYRGPWLYGSYGPGLDEVWPARFHRHLRARPRHPPRPGRSSSTPGRRSTSTTTSPG